MDSLPSEIVEYLLGFLERHDKLFARYVCREWRSFIPPADIWSDDYDTPIRYVIDCDYKDLVFFLVEDMGVRKGLLEAAVASGDMSLMDYVDMFIDWNDPILCAPTRNHVEMLTYLFEEKGLWIDERMIYNLVGTRSLEAVQYIYTLLDPHGRDRIMRDVVMLTAADFDIPELVKWLISKRVGITLDACFIAADSCSLESLKIFIEGFETDEWVIWKATQHILSSGNEKALPCLEYLASIIPSLDVWDHIAKCCRETTHPDAVNFLYQKGFITDNNLIEINTRTLEEL